uniref:Uncharacterized protein n=1 Tax=Candidatus Kentrum sp. TC TaxID=2126339 RepID=A0A450ZGF5_9GAMM|nr:MAG: hypothetical protein BECKTC1821D_GA0114238_12223 [Candidatus Kentron sp. TC]
MRLLASRISVATFDPIRAVLGNYRVKETMVLERQPKIPFVPYLQSPSHAPRPGLPRDLAFHALVDAATGSDIRQDFLDEIRRSPRRQEADRLVLATRAEEPQVAGNLFPQWFAKFERMQQRAPEILVQGKDRKVEGCAATGAA